MPHVILAPDVSHDLFTPDEVARAAGVSAGDVDALVRSGDLALVAGRFMTYRDAVRAGRRLGGSSVAPRRTPAVPATHRKPQRRAPDLLEPRRASGQPPAGATSHEGRVLFAPLHANRRSRALPVAISGAVHGMAGLLVVVLASAGLGTTVVARLDPADLAAYRLVFLAQPGPGGGGGGGGLRQSTPARAARRMGTHALSSPVPSVEVPRPLEPRPAPPEAPVPPPEPPIVAPVASQPGDDRDERGVIDQPASPSPTSQGPGDGGGSGSGLGTGIGEGDGPGIGAGSGGGTGGGPYRPGSGIEPPRLLREVRADYSEDARRRGVQGEVLLEIVVRRDGSTGDVRLVRGLGYGLDARAIDAVRQWRFLPARRLGQPVDVLVEVAVEFRLR
jgi:protein TonB